ncbi:MAG: glucosaminidase domain-containing protein, partial [Chloroflexi bacterium]|nr:glucosaminidase domain-containing protein [Chloroflexota bacterium]
MPQLLPATLRASWRARGEALVITVLALVGLSLPPLLVLELLTPRQAARGAVVLAWAAASLLLLRLPALLRCARRRVALLTVGALAGAGLALTPAAEAQGGLSFRAAPRISQGAFSQILANAGSPAAPHADELYAIIVAYGLDPAVALAFFQHESQYCTTGACARGDLQNWGMLRRAIRPGRSVGTAQGFARYVSWQEGVRDWCELILGYINRGMDTVEKAVPVYAPQSDGNVPAAYIGAIRRQVAAWAGRAVGEPALRA